MKKQTPGMGMSKTRTSRNPDVQCENLTLRRARRRSAGFTLTEILVSISIIILLIGLSSFGAMAAMKGAAITKTNATMQGAMGALTEYKFHVGSNIPWDRTLPLTSGEQFVYGCSQLETSNAMLVTATNADKKMFTNADNNFINGTPAKELRDAWGREILYRPSNSGSSRVTETITEPIGARVTINNAMLPNSDKPYLISSGPDKRFGTTDDITTLDLAE